MAVISENIQKKNKLFHNDGKGFFLPHRRWESSPAPSIPQPCRGQLLPSSPCQSPLLAADRSCLRAALGEAAEAGRAQMAGRSSAEAGPDARGRAPLAACHRWVQAGISPSPVIITSAINAAPRQRGSCPCLSVCCRETGPEPKEESCGFSQALFNPCMLDAQRATEHRD